MDVVKVRAPAGVDVLATLDVGEDLGLDDRLLLLHRDANACAALVVRVLEFESLALVRVRESLRRRDSALVAPP